MTRQGAGHHVFVDETKRRGLVMVGVQVALDDLARTRSTEPLLWAADAVAWCVVHAGWREQVAPVVQRRHAL